MLAAIAGIVLAVGTSSFTSKIFKKAKDPTTYYYTYSGTVQDQDHRNKGVNYTSPSTSPLSCSPGAVNECGVSVSIPEGMSAPANISGLSITYDNSSGGTGCPNGGSSLSQNFLKNN